METLISRIHHAATVDEILDAVFSELRGLVPYDSLALTVIEDDRNTLRWIAVRSAGPTELKAGYSCRIWDSLVAPGIDCGEVRIVEDFEEDRLRTILWAPEQIMLREGMRSSLALPLCVNNAPIGIVLFASRTPIAYAKEHGKILREPAAHVALAIERMRLSDTLAAEVRELEAENERKALALRRLQDEIQRETLPLEQSRDRAQMLLRIASAIAASRDLEAIFRVAVEELRRFLRFDRASITLLDGTGQNFRFAALEPPQRDILGRDDQIPAGSSALGNTTRGGKTAIARDLARERNYYEDELLHQAGIRSYVFTPLILHGVAIGTFNAGSSAPDAFAEEDIALLAALAKQVTIAVAKRTLAPYFER